MRAAAKPSEAAVRLYFMVARAARTAVVFRRGPTKQVQMLHWDLARDVVTPGQWLSGRLYNERCDLSPSGRLLVYFAGKFTGDIPTFTAICRPPYFTALALWKEHGTWGGGGCFEHDRRLVLNSGDRDSERAGGRSIPADFVIEPWSMRPTLPTGDDLWPQNRGWTRIADGIVTKERTPRMFVSFTEPQVHEKPNPLHPRLALERSLLGRFETNGPTQVYSYRLLERTRRDPSGPPAHSEPLGRLDWADWDLDGSLLFGHAGCLWRRQMSGSLAGPRAPATVVADLRAHGFTNLPPPDSARVWP